MAENNIKELDFDRKHEEDLQRLRGLRLRGITAVLSMQMSQNRVKNMKICVNPMLYLLRKMI